MKTCDFQCDALEIQYVSFVPLPGKIKNIFQMGWFNHQLVIQVDRPQLTDITDNKKKHGKYRGTVDGSENPAPVDYGKNPLPLVTGQGFMHCINIHTCIDQACASALV